MAQEASRSNMGSIEEMILRIVGDHLGVPGSTLSPETHIMDDLGADSLDRLELLMTVEELFNIKIPEDEVAGIERINDIMRAIKKLAGSNQVGNFALSNYLTNPKKGEIG